MKEKFKREVFEITTKEYVIVCPFDCRSKMLECPEYLEKISPICIHSKDNKNIKIRNKYCCNYNLEEFPQKTTKIKPVDLNETNKRKIKETIKNYLFAIHRIEDDKKTINRDYKDFFLENHTTKELDNYHNVTKKYSDNIRIAERMYNEIFEYVKPKLIKYLRKYVTDEKESEIIIRSIKILKESIEYSYIINKNYEMINSPVMDKITYDELFS